MLNTDKYFTLTQPINTIKGNDTKKGKPFKIEEKHKIIVEKDTPYIAMCESEDRVFMMPAILIGRYYKELRHFTDKEISEAEGKEEVLSLAGELVKSNGWDKEGFPSINLAAGRHENDKKR